MHTGKVREPSNDHGAVHDKSDDKLKLIKYELSTRNDAANNVTIT